MISIDRRQTWLGLLRFVPVCLVENMEDIHNSGPCYGLQHGAQGALSHTSRLSPHSLAKAPSSARLAIVAFGAARTSGHGKLALECIKNPHGLNQYYLENHAPLAIICLDLRLSGDTVIHTYTGPRSTSLNVALH